MDRAGEPVQVTHRGASSGGEFRGIPIHAAAGVHDYAFDLVKHRAPPSARVLDIGCGSGALSARLADAGFDVTACDLDLDDYAADPPATIWDIGADSIPAELVDTFDVVCAIEVLEHVENPLLALRNIRRTLRPEGILVASTPNIGHPRSRLKFLVRGAPAYFGSAEYMDTGHRTLLPDWLLRRHLEAVGFGEIDVSYAGTFGLHGVQRVAYLALVPMFQLFRMMPSPRDRDGSATFVTARRP
jgi:SAM-dependent methyltransferase